jgi:signal peptidase I
VAGWRLENVQTDSMTPAIPRGSLAVVAPEDPRSIEVGHVISFVDRSRERRRVLHRVANVIDRGASGLFFETQGDANTTPDSFLVPFRNVEGRLRWHIPRIGSVAWTLRPPAGLALFVGLPAAVLLLAGRRKALQPSEPSALGAEAEQSLQRRESTPGPSASWDAYYVRTTRATLRGADLARAVAGSWRDYYVDLARTEIDVRDRVVVVDPSSQPSPAAFGRRTEQTHSSGGRGE